MNGLPETRPVSLPASGGARLEGLLAVPDGARALVVFAHGSGSSRLSPRNGDVAQALQRARLATLLFDLLTPAEDEAGRSGATERVDIPMLATRLAEATAWAREREELRSLPTGLFGASTGGAAALVAAVQLGDAVRAIVSRGGRPDLAGDLLPRVTAPTLLIVGSADTPVIAENRKAFARVGAEKELVIVPNATHLFEELGAMEAVTRYAVEWFTRHLVPPAPPAWAEARRTEDAP